MAHNDRFNGERYIDMTAYLAMRNIERDEMRKTKLREDWDFDAEIFTICQNKLTVLIKRLNNHLSKSVSGAKFCKPGYVCFARQSIICKNRLYTFNFSRLSGNQFIA
ncbi:MAG: hypothetical protein ACOX4O_10630 [Eubacteriales bacterium]|jgi:hypothetical protein